MYLKSLTMHGFKSFPDKTVISFDRGVTAIVGPNGSGKSNISDAVRWVLGEMSPKSLRGSKMEDVIFNGTTLRKPAGYAEVVMTLDNTDRKSTYNADEINVGRRLYRSGESEYYINNNQVRLRDVVDIFLNTGIGKEGYSVIGQGKISDVISGKTEERRGIFEEAAGISKLRYQKKDAQNKLEKVSDNLLRINDILVEVESRLPSLERQSEKASKWVVLKDERTKLEISSFAERIAAINRESGVLGNDKTLEENKLAEINAKIDGFEAQVEQIYLEIQKTKLRESNLQGEKDNIASALADCERELSVLENDMGHFTESTNEIANEKERNEKRLSDFDIEIKEINESIEKIKAESDGISNKSADNIRKAEEIKAGLPNLREELEKTEKELETLISAKNEFDLMQKEGESYNAIRNERLLEVEGKRNEAKAEFDREKAKYKELEKNIDEAEDKSAEKKKILLESEEKLEKLEAREKELAEEKQKYRLKSLELTQRRDTLERMERLLDGFSGSVKTVMSAFRDKEISGIHGPVSGLIVTDNEYIIAIETALGGAMQNIVVDDEKSAKDAIFYLKRTNSGRATFLPLTTVKGSLADVREVKGKKGFISVASELIRCDGKYKGIVDQLLGRTVVADNIDNGNDIAKAMGYKARIVTLDGQIINAGGSFTGGQSLKNTNILTRKADIEKLSLEIDDINKKVSKLTSDITEVNGEMQGIKGGYLELEREVEILKREEIECDKALALSEERLASIKKTLDEANEEYESVKKTSELTGSSLADVSEKKAKVEKEIELKKAEEEAKKAEISSAEGEIVSLIESNTELSGMKAELDVKSASYEERLRAIDDLKSEIARAIRDGEEKKEYLENRFKDANRKIADIKLRRDEIEKKLSQKANEVAEAKKESEALEARSMSIRADEKVLEGEKEISFKLVTKLTSRLEELDREKVSILTHLAEDYEMDYDKALVFASSSQGESNMTKEEKEARLTEIRAEMKKLGSVNIDSIEEYKQTKERYDFLKGQFDDASSAKSSLEKMILGLDTSMREKFSSSLSKIQKAFKETFIELFGGGNAEIVVTGDDVLDCQIDINVQPPGKIIKSLTLLSGGEQSITAIALYLAILKVSPSPFCIFDEIEAALDDANVARFGDYLRKYSISTQFIVITHRRGTMESADMLYGITMQEKGVSDYLRVTLDEYQGEIN